MQTPGTAVAVREEPEAAVIARARAGDESAIRSLVQANNQRLYRAARAILGDDADAEDVVQEAYLRAFRSLDGFRGQSSFSTWLTRIALNEALQRLRSRRRAAARHLPRPVPELPEAGIITFPGAVPPADPERAAARRQLRELVEAAVERLPRPLRLVFVLRDVEELTIAETAAQLRIPAATVKTRLHRARKQIRDHLDAEIAASLRGTFPFLGMRCARMADRVVEGLRGAPDEPPARG